MSLLVALAFLPGAPGTFAGVFAILLSPFAFFIFIIVAYRFASRRLLWTVRNRLILTSLLMGLAPVILFGTLAAVSAYTFAGQFATNAASVELNDEIGRLRDRATATAAPIERLLELELTPHDLQNFHVPRSTAATAPAAQPRHEAGFDASIAVMVWVDGKPFSAPSERAAAAPKNGTSLNARAHVSPATAAGRTSPFASVAVPGWLKPGFSGVLEKDGRLYVAAAVGGETGGRQLLGLATTSLDHSNLQNLAKGLGTISVFRTSSFGEEESAHPGIQHTQTDPLDFNSIEGGHTPPAAYFFDGKVVFTAPLPVTEWRTGADVHAMLGVVSRPTLLYSRLFATSVHIGSLVRNGLIAITIFFALLELLAFLLALRLSRTITRSIADLYSATTQIDRGNLGHRIEVRRRDQLGALATSFNTMAGSLAELLVQQREKERMQNELEIAQEVQNNLFPHTPIRVPNFEVHGVCKPARTVSGDYYDFILSGPRAAEPHGTDGQICLALGDISGKGISAALLMASLHSAVRAYHSSEPLGGQGEGSPAPSPARLLGLLNRHLFSSTQPEKYATLFVACYDGQRQELTYSNGGHLTPLVFRADGRNGTSRPVEKLECGGSVVGLLDGLHYAEGTVRLDRGDLLVIYSDGLTEPENEFGEFGEDRLIEVLEQNRTAPLGTIAAKVMRALETWIGENEQPDDMTLVLARQL